MTRLASVLVTASLALLTQCFQCPAGTVGNACYEGAVVVNNASEDPVVFVIVGADGARRDFYKPSRSEEIIDVGAGGCLGGPVEVRTPDEDDRMVGGELLGELEMPCEGDQRTWWGPDGRPD